MKKIYFDLDDVLVDTSAQTFLFHGLDDPFGDPKNCGRRDISKIFNMSWEDYWDALPQDFWEKVPKMPWCDQSIKIAEELVGPSNVYFLSSPIPNGICSAGKQIWVNKNFPSYKGRLILAHEKFAVVGSDGLLIDDSQENEKEFNSRGKNWNFVLFPSYQNELNGLVSLMYREPDIAVNIVKNSVEMFLSND